jgi:hypothetical protein
MKRFAALLLLFFVMSPLAVAQHAHGGSSHSSGRSHKSSRKARGHYEGGIGSSHKGGHYKNPATHDHYRKRHP